MKHNQEPMLLMKRGRQEARAFFITVSSALFCLFSQHGLVFAAVTAVDANAQQDNKKWW